MNKYPLPFLVSLLFLLFFSLQALALPAKARLFQQKYGYKAPCMLCHTKGGGSELSDYGRAIQRAGSNLAAFSKVELKDSDGDGFSNITEIMAKSNPDDPRSTPDHPGNWLAKVEELPLPKEQLTKLYPNQESFAYLGDRTLYPEQVARIEKVLGEPLKDEDKVPTFYFPVQKTEGKEKRIGIAMFMVTEGKKGPLSLGIALDNKGKILQVVILKYEDKKKLAQESFLKQFEGKSAKDSVQLGVDIQPVAGEEETSKAIALSVKKSLLTVQEVFAAKK